MTTKPAERSKEYIAGDFPEGHPSSYQRCPTGLYFGKQTGKGVSLWCKPYFLGFALHIPHC